jgi:hypothetical protein
MKRLVAATVTVDDLKTYFKGEHWRSSFRDGVFEARSDSYYVELKPTSSPQFAVSVHAYEDESDKDEAVTDEPMKFLVDFLKTGTAGDEALQKMAAALEPSMHNYMPPPVLSNLLRAWAADAEAQRIGPRTLARLLRHATVLPSLPQAARLLHAVIRMAGREEVETKEMQDLANKMTEKGWRVKAGKNDRGLPELTVDIAGVYEAKIEIDHIPWHYSFEVHEHPDTRVEGVTDDPIVEFRKFYKSDVVQTAKGDLKAVHKEKREQAEQEGTVAPSTKKRKPPEEPHGEYESGGPP